MPRVPLEGRLPLLSSAKRCWSVVTNSRNGFLLVKAARFTTGSGIVAGSVDAWLVKIYG
jgi:hypothetical protein